MTSRSDIQPSPVPWDRLRDLSGLQVLVVGLARSGRAAARLCLREGARVRGTDLRTDVAPMEGCPLRLGEHRTADFTGADLVVVSPGVPPDLPEICAATEAGVPVVGELGLAMSRIRAPMIGVTGTNGKSTVVHFVGQLLRAAGRRTFVGGNTGCPLSEAVLADEDLEAVVIEVSSYQLQEPIPARLRVACILNLTPDHLARHGTLEAYARTKVGIFELLEEAGTAILPAGQGLLQDLGGRAAPGALRLGGRPGVELESEETCILDFGDGSEQVSLAGFSVPGAHNRANAAAAMLVCRVFGIPARALEPRVLRSLPHRMEPVAEGGGVSWINDSKATNVEAARAGLEGMRRPVVALLGGQGKQGDDYGALLPALSATRSVICFGASGAEIARALARLAPERVETLAQAVDRAAEIARPGDAVVLSPACASFDAFRDFEHRGDTFRALATARVALPGGSARSRAGADSHPRPEGTAPRTLPQEVE